MIGENGGSSADLRENRGILESGRNSILSGREIYLRDDRTLSNLLYFN